MFREFQYKVKVLKKDILALFLAYKRPEVSIYAKLLAVIVVGYALSPIDLVPDFIPIIGYLDDLILLPLGISILLKLIPKSIMDECRKEALIVFKESKPTTWIAGVIIIIIWIMIVTYIIHTVLN